jgi:hypothetical protein
VPSPRGRDFLPDQDGGADPPQHMVENVVPARRRDQREEASGRDVVVVPRLRSVGVEHEPGDVLAEQLRHRPSDILARPAVVAQCARHAGRDQPVEPARSAAFVAGSGASNVKMN